jgi:hypothetical protein
MLLRHRSPRIESTAAEPAGRGYEHLDESWLTLLRWLQASRVEFVLVGPAARAIRGEAGARGPLTVVPAPYGRNLDRLAKALWSGHARLRVDAGPDGSAGADTVPVKLTAEKLVRAEGWTLRCGSHDLDVEGRRPGTPRYQELLYEATRFELATGLAVEVAAPEDIEHYDHVQRTGVAPEMRITRREPSHP